MEIVDFFQGLDTEASNFILIVAIASFLLGAIVLWLLQGARIIKLRRALKKSEKELEKANNDIKGLQAEIKKLQDTIERLKYDLHEAKVKADRLEMERSKFYNETLLLKEKLENAQLETLQVKKDLESLEEEQHKLSNEIEQHLQQIAFLEERIEKDDSQTNNLAQMQSVFNATKQRLESMEDRIFRLEQENSVLKNQIHSAGNGIQGDNSVLIVDSVDNTVKPVLISEMDTGTIEEEPEIKIQDEKPGLNKRIDINEYDKDDLTKIEGIGPFLEKKLNDNGFFSYEQIAALDDEDIISVTRIIGHIPGRIEQDNWVQQAQELAQNKTTNFQVARRTVENFSPDDLTVIEGIGPKISSILKEAGIKNWQDLAETDDEQLNAILLAAGPAYKIIDTSSWPAQAQLALKGEWDLLREYREELNGSGGE